MTDSKLYCGFCWKSKDEVKLLIAGNTAHICDECVMLCYDIVATKLQVEAPIEEDLAALQSRARIVEQDAVALRREVEEFGTRLVSRQSQADAPPTGEETP